MPANRCGPFALRARPAQVRKMEQRLPPDEDQHASAFFAKRGVNMDAHRAVFETIRAASVMVTVMEERALRPVGLTHAGYRILCELWIKGPLQVRNLAAFMTVSRPTIVGTVDTLEASGFVTRDRSTLDRRLVTVALTSQGLQAVEGADAAWHVCQVQVMSELSSQEQRQLAALSRRAAQQTMAVRRAAGRPAEPADQPADASEPVSPTAGPTSPPTS